MTVTDVLSANRPRRTLGSLAQRVQDIGHPEAEPLSVYLGRGVVRRQDASDNHNALGSDLAKYQLVQPGDLVFNRLRTWQGGFGASAYRGIVSPAYIVLRPRDADARFLQYLLLSKPYLAELTRISKWMPPSQFDIMWADLKSVVVPDLPLDEQRRIADFLDERVALIDRIIEARRAQVEGVASDVDVQWQLLTDELDGPLVPLRRFLRSIVDGPFGSSLSSKHYTDHGVRVIRLGNIGIAEFRDTDRAYISPEYGAALEQHSVRPGDLIMAGLGDDRWPLGRSAVVPEGLGPAIVKADCYRVRLDERLEHEFAALALSSPQARAEARYLSRGSTRARLNTEIARELRIPLVTTASQSLYSAKVRNLMHTAESCKAALGAAITLLTEYKQSLITAAVTGELDVTTASTRLPHNLGK